KSDLKRSLGWKCGAYCCRTKAGSSGYALSFPPMKRRPGARRHGRPWIFRKLIAPVRIGLHAVITAAQQLIEPVVHRLLNEVHRAVTKADLGPPEVVRLDPPGDVPFPLHVQHRGRVAPVCVAAEVVDRNDRGAVSITAVVAPPSILSKVIVL